MRRRSRVLNSWTHMIGIATPHLAEDWWSQLGGEGLLAGHIMDEVQAVSEEDQALLDGEALIRDLLKNKLKGSQCC